MEAFGKFIHTGVPRLAAQALLPRVNHHQFSTNLPHQAQASAQPMINKRTECDYEELSNMLAVEDVALVDVRSENELLKYGSIPGAIHIPLREVKKALQMSEAEFTNHFFLQKPNKKSRNLIFFARGPNASSAAVEIAHKLGFKSSRQYSGGWEDYCKQTGLPLMKRSQESPDFMGSYNRSTQMNNRFYM